MHALVTVREECVAIRVDEVGWAERTDLLRKHGHNSPATLNARQSIGCAPERAQPFQKDAECQLGVGLPHWAKTLQCGQALSLAVLASFNRRTSPSM
jgi:hypothetical protein